MRLERRMSLGSPSNGELIKVGGEVTEAQQKMERASKRWFELVTIEEEA